MLAAALVLLVLLPATAHAWTPGTHVFLGEAVLRSLVQLPDAIAQCQRMRREHHGATRAHKELVPG